MFEKEIAGWKNAKNRRGKRELLKHLSGGNLTPRQAITAGCYDCMGGYEQVDLDCKIPSCPRYQFMPYRAGGVRKNKRPPKVAA
jgi:hypothetical protein